MEFAGISAALQALILAIIVNMDDDTWTIKFVDIWFHILLSTRMDSIYTRTDSRYQLNMETYKKYNGYAKNILKIAVKMGSRSIHDTHCW